MFLSVVLMPIFFGLCILVDGPVPLLIPFTIFFAGLTLMLYARLFGEEIPHVKSQQAQSSTLGSMSGNNGLPLASNIWTNSVGGQQVRTAELVKPPSVTEHTTKLLDQE